MSDLDDSFAKLLGRQPSDAERQSLYRVRDALGLKNNDALWLVLMALQHYQGQYEKFPQAIAQAAKDTLVNFKVTADATVKASAEAAKADLAQAVAAAAQEVAHNTSAKQMWQWAAGCGTDAAPYFRVFNPTTQGDKFDPDGVYVKRWVPELGEDGYPEPIVDHAAERAEGVEGDFFQSGFCHGFCFLFSACGRLSDGLRDNVALYVICFLRATVRG